MLKQAHALTEEIIEWRRDFHMHPETGFDVHRTAGIVADELEKLGYRVKRGVGKTGVVADLGEGGPLVAIRADMDALPLQEMNEARDCEISWCITGAPISSVGRAFLPRTTSSSGRQWWPTHASSLMTCWRI